MVELRAVGASTATVALAFVFFVAVNPDLSNAWQHAPLPHRAAAIASVAPPNIAGTYVPRKERWAGFWRMFMTKSNPSPDPPSDPLLGGGGGGENEISEFSALNGEGTEPIDRRQARRVGKITAEEYRRIMGLPLEPEPSKPRPFRRKKKAKNKTEPKKTARRWDPFGADKRTLEQVEAAAQARKQKLVGTSAEKGDTEESEVKNSMVDLSANQNAASKLDAATNGDSTSKAEPVVTNDELIIPKAKEVTLQEVKPVAPIAEEYRELSVKAQEIKSIAPEIEEVPRIVSESELSLGKIESTEESKGETSTAGPNATQDASSSGVITQNDGASESEPMITKDEPVVEKVKGEIQPTVSEVEAIQPIVSESEVPSGKTEGAQQVLPTSQNDEDEQIIPKPEPSDTTVSNEDAKERMQNDSSPVAKADEEKSSSDVKDSEGELEEKPQSDSKPNTSSAKVETRILTPKATIDKTVPRVDSTISKVESIVAEVNSAVAKLEAEKAQRKERAKAKANLPSSKVGADIPKPKPVLVTPPSKAQVESETAAPSSSTPTDPKTSSSETLDQLTQTIEQPQTGDSFKDEKKVSESMENDKADVFFNVEKDKGEAAGEETLDALSSSADSGESKDDTSEQPQLPAGTDPVIDYAPAIEESTNAKKIKDEANARKLLEARLRYEQSAKDTQTRVAKTDVKRRHEGNARNLLEARIKYSQMDKNRKQSSTPFFIAVPPEENLSVNVSKAEAPDKPIVRAGDKIEEEPIPLPPRPKREGPPPAVDVEVERFIPGVSPQEAKQAWFSYIWEGGQGQSGGVVGLSKSDGGPTKHKRRLLLPSLMEEALVDEAGFMKDSDRAASLRYIMYKPGPALKGDIVNSTHFAGVDFRAFDGGTQMVWYVSYDVKRRPATWQRITKLRIGEASDKLLSYLAPPIVIQRNTTLIGMKSIKEAMDVWQNYVWRDGGNLPVPVLSLGGGDRVVFPAFLVESIQSVDYETGTISYTVSNPSLFTAYPVHSHEAQVRFVPTPSGNIEMLWKVSVKPKKDCELFVKSLTEYIINTLSTGMVKYTESPTRRKGQTSQIMSLLGDSVNRLWSYTKEQYQATKELSYDYGTIDSKEPESTEKPQSDLQDSVPSEEDTGNVTFVDQVDILVEDQINVTINNVPKENEETNVAPVVAVIKETHAVIDGPQDDEIHSITNATDTNGYSLESPAIPPIVEEALQTESALQAESVNLTSSEPPKPEEVFGGILPSSAGNRTAEAALAREIFETIARENLANFTAARRDRNVSAINKFIVSLHEKYSTKDDQNSTE